MLLNLNIIIMYSSEDLEIKCKSNTMKLVSFVEMHPLLYKDFISSIKPRCCLMVNRYRVLCKDKVPYNIFSKWYKDTRKQIVEVYVDF